jgi:hypothetical protein
MRFRQFSLIALLFTACGGEQPQIALSMSGLNASANKATLQVHVRERSCDDILDSGPRKRASYDLDLRINGMPGNGEISGILPNTYTVFVWTFTDADEVLDFGCAPDVVIERDAMTTVELELAPYTGP